MHRPPLPGARSKYPSTLGAALIRRLWRHAAWHPHQPIPFPPAVRYPQVRNVTYAASNSVVKASRRARTALSHLAPEPVRHYASGAHVDPHGHHRHQQHAGHGGGTTDAAGAGAGGAEGSASSPVAAYGGRTYGQRDLVLVSHMRAHTKVHRDSMLPVLPTFRQPASRTTSSS